MSGLIHRDQRELLTRREDVFHAWLDQISKDLGERIFEDVMPKTWEVVVHKIQKHLANTYQITAGEIPELLYRIDLSEAKLREDMERGGWSDWYELLAHRIAEREAQKVIFRFQYSGKL